MPATPTSYGAAAPRAVSFEGMMTLGSGLAGGQRAANSREWEPGGDSTGYGYAVHSRGAFRIRDPCVRDGQHGEAQSTQKQCDRAATSTRFAELRDRRRTDTARGERRDAIRCSRVGTRMRPASVRPSVRRKRRRRQKRREETRARWISLTLRRLTFALRSAKQDIAHESRARNQLRPTRAARGAWLLGYFRRYSATLGQARH